MKMFNLKISILILCLFFGLKASAQSDSAFVQPKLSDELVIPPLDSLYKWAELNSALIKQQEALMEKTNADTRRVKKQWMNAIKFSGNIRAGNYGNNIINQVETGYSYGPNITFSLYELASNKNLVDVFKAEEKVAAFKKDQAVFDLKRYVAILYNNLNTQKNILKIRSEALNTAYVHVKMAEKEFSEGAISLAELSRVTEIYSKSQTDIELTINDLKNYYMQLEQICGKTFQSN
jgi:outer membrane protein TolC